MKFITNITPQDAENMAMGGTPTYGPNARRTVLGSPCATRAFTKEEVTGMGMRGLYVEDEYEVLSAVAGSDDRKAAEGDAQPETAVERRVGEVIKDLTDGRVVPKQVDDLGRAVDRAKTNAAAGRAIGARNSVRIGLLLPAVLLCAALASSSPLRAETGWGGGQSGSEAGGKVTAPLQPGCYHTGQFSPWIVNRSAIAPSVSGPVRAETGWAEINTTVNPVIAPDHVTTIDQLVSVFDLIQEIKDDRAAEKALADSKEDTVKVWLFDVPQFNRPVSVSKSAVMVALRGDEDSKADAIRRMGVK